MNNPKEKLRKYLDQLVHKFLNIKSLFSELNRIILWSSPEREEALNHGLHFFQLATYSMTRIYLVELAAMLSDREERSLIDWLQNACVHAKDLGPSRYNPSDTDNREIIKPHEYRDIIEKNLIRLDSYNDLTERIKTWRDKSITHFDKTFFDNPSLIYKKYQINNCEINKLIECISEILHEHYSYIFHADSRMEIISSTNIDSILMYVQAFQMARKDKKLIKSGFIPANYLDNSAQQSDLMRTRNS